ncbi:MAG: Uma2 family endonuclease [Verrucomicrobiales bacterium]|jgi:Uma2 family endonuclease
MPLVIEMPPREEQLAFNRSRWGDVLRDPELAKLPGKVETDRHGQILIMPPPSGSHSSKQSCILLALHGCLGGKPLAECPISTADGVRAADVGWYSPERFRQVDGQDAFEEAPEICVEVVSPSNTPRGLAEKRDLYFDAGAEEVWICQLDGEMQFYLKGDPTVPASRSALCPGFQARVE